MGPSKAVICIIARLWLLASCASLASCSSQLRISIWVPELAKVNDAIWLNCSYHMTTTTSANSSDQQAEPSEQIYAIKWFKNEDEFYRFAPNEVDARESSYETSGIQLDVSTYGTIIVVATSVCVVNLKAKRPANDDCDLLLLLRVRCDQQQQ